MALDTLTKAEIKKLNLGLDEEAVFAAIEEWPNLMERLNKFIIQRGGSINLAENDSNSQFENNTIYIGTVAIGSNNKYGVVLHLAHEVTHALSTKTMDDSSLEKYVASRNEREGEALLYEFSALLKIYGGLEVFEKDIWQDGEVEIKFKANIFSDIFRDIFGSDPKYDPDKDTEAGRNAKIKALAEVNKTIIWGEFESTTGKKSGISFTYGEMAVWDWLNRKTNLAVDYLEAFGIQVPGDDEAARRTAAFNTITASTRYSGDIKVLVNQANNYLGSEISDDLEIKGDTALGGKYGHEMLWGGLDSDVLMAG